ncbi:MAG: hypothetical protein KL787_08970 [Taibaiella sp.]|nr:hypothetical protein [Taibaiella sp.]
MAQTSNGSIDVRIEQQIGTVEFYHPLSNSMPGTLLHELASADYPTGD